MIIIVKHPPSTAFMIFLQTSKTYFIPSFIHQRPLRFYSGMLNIDDDDDDDDDDDAI